MKNNELIFPDHSLEKKRKKGCMIAAAVLGCILTAIVAGAVWIGLELQLHQDLINTAGNIGRVYARLEDYKAEHRYYPEQQDMKTLLKTLDIDDHDFFKVLLYDIRSAVYYAPSQDSEKPVITMCIRKRLFGKKELLVRDQDLWHYEDIEPEPDDERQ